MILKGTKNGMSKLVYFFLLFFFFGCKKKQEKIFPSRQSISESVYASGSIKSRFQYEAFSTVTGIIKEKLVKEGDTVKIGTPLILLSNEVQKLATENALLLANYSDYGSNNKKLKELLLRKELALEKLVNDSILSIRQRRLWEQGIGSKFELERSELNFQNSRAMHKLSVLQLAMLERDLSYQSKQALTNWKLSKEMEESYLIRSKINGLVYSFLKDKGELVSPQLPLALLGDATAFFMELMVDEYDIVRIKRGQKVFVTLDSYKGEVFEGIVKRILPSMNERTKSFIVEADFVDQPTKLYPHLTLEANILIRSKKDALTIPRDYLLDGNYVLNASNKKIKVTVDLEDYQKVEITSGITEEFELIKGEE